MFVNVLGTQYAVLIKKYDEDKAFERLRGYCDGVLKTIVVCDPSTFPGYEGEPQEYLDACKKETLRHELVHAFLDESGLEACAVTVDGSWAKNEEMIDWIALQGPKLYKAWKEAGAI